MAHHGHCDELASSLDIGCKSFKYSLLLQPLFARDNQLTSGSKDFGSKDFVVADFHAEDIDNSSVSDDEDLNCLVLEDFENVHIEDGNCNGNGMHGEGNPCLSTIITKTKVLTIDSSDESSALAKCSGDATMKPVCVTVKPLSALKGSRAKQGMPLDQAIRVTWAPDVYDPPVTSSSHTVKGYHHRRPKSKKDHYKHKHMKGKSSKTSSNDRRHSHRSSTSSVIDPRITRLRAFADRSWQTGFGHSKLHADVAAARSQESNCGGSFHMELHCSLPLPLPPVAEAS